MFNAKRFFALVSVLAMLLCMLPAAVNAETEQTTLSIVWWGSQTRHDLTTALIAKFEEKNPDIKLEMEFTDWGGYWSKLAAQVAGGLTPDIFQMDYGYLTQYAENKVLAPLKPYIDSGIINVADVSENVLQSGSVGGELYALSTGTNAPVMLYRKDLLAQAGVELPQDPTLSEYIAASKAVYEATGMRDTWIVEGSVETLRNRLRSYGLSLYNEDQTTLGFDDPKYIVDMWNTILTAQNEGYGMIPGEETAATEYSALISDTWALSRTTNVIQAYTESTGFELGMCAVPDMDDATVAGTFLKPAMFWCIAEQSAKKEAAARFLDFFTNDPDCFDIVGIERAIPISSVMREHVASALSAGSQEALALINYFSEEGNSSPLYPADPVAHHDVTDLLNQLTEQLRYGMLTDLDAEAAQFIADANEILAKATPAQ